MDRERAKKRNLAAKSSRGQHGCSLSISRAVDFPNVWASRDDRARFARLVVSGDGIPAGRRSGNRRRANRHPNGWHEALRHAVPAEVASLTFNLVVLFVEGEVP